MCLDGDVRNMSGDERNVSSPPCSHFLWNNVAVTKDSVACMPCEVILVERGHNVIYMCGRKLSFMILPHAYAGIDMSKRAYTLEKLC